MEHRKIIAITRRVAFSCFRINEDEGGEKGAICRVANCARAARGNRQTNRNTSPPKGRGVETLKIIGSTPNPHRSRKTIAVDGTRRRAGGPANRTGSPDTSPPSLSPTYRLHVEFPGSSRYNYCIRLAKFDNVASVDCCGARPVIHPGRDLPRR